MGSSVSRLMVNREMETYFYILKQSLGSTQSNCILLLNLEMTIVYLVCLSRAVVYNHWDLRFHNMCRKTPICSSSVLICILCEKHWKGISFPKYQNITRITSIDHQGMFSYVLGFFERYYFSGNSHEYSKICVIHFWKTCESSQGHFHSIQVWLVFDVIFSSNLCN